MKRLIGVLCCVTFILTCACCLVIGSDTTSEVHQTSTDNYNDADQDKTKATSLEIVWMEGCPPCRRLRVVALRLIAEGYDIYFTNVKDDPRGARRTPTLRYYLPRGGMLHEEVGFKTANHIKKYLGK